MTTETPASTFKRKRGPSARPQALRRTKRLNVFFSPDEYEALETRKGRIGLSEYVRHCVFNSESAAPGVMIPELNLAAWTELSRVASNLNQIAHRLNMNEDVAFNEVRELFTAFRMSLINAQVTR